MKLLPRLAALLTAAAPLCALAEMAPHTAAERTIVRVRPAEARPAAKDPARIGAEGAAARLLEARRLVLIDSAGTVYDLGPVELRARASPDAPPAYAVDPVHGGT